MTNVTIEKRPDGRIALIFSPTESHGASSTGKTEIVATSHGAAKIPGESDALRFNLTVFRK